MRIAGFRYCGLIVIIIIFFQGCLTSSINILDLSNCLSNVNSDTIKKLPPKYMKCFCITFKLYRGKVVQPYRNKYGIWHKICNGHTLSGIAKRYGAGRSEIYKINKLTKWELNRGYDLFIPISSERIEGFKKYVKVMYSDGYFCWPLEGEMTSYFGLRNGKFHKGLDIAARYGSKIVSACDGVVSYTGHQRFGYGKVVYIKHEGNFYTRYAHLSRYIVKKGYAVKKGQVIGYVGKTGRATGSHLHFEIRVKDQAIDPEIFLPQKKEYIISKLGD